ncbi:MAG: DUF2846 domain-containing protein [Betaproteobacteria bacterium]
MQRSRPMPSIRIPTGALLSAFCILLAACASTPQASRERDAQAKEFNTHPGTAALYVYRPDTAFEEESVLYVGGRLIGATLPGTYFRIDLRPGAHRLQGTGVDNGSITIEAHPGALYFVSLRVVGSQSHFERVDDATARQSIQSCCALLENWSPGQRPLLR